MGNIKFGSKQINHPTPASINLWVRVFTVTAGIFILWMPSSGIVGQHAQDLINSLLGLILALINGLAPLFGVQVTGKVDAADVTAIETEAKP